MKNPQVLYAGTIKNNSNGYKDFLQTLFETPVDKPMRKTTSPAEETMWILWRSIIGAKV